MDMDMENHRQPHNQPLTIIHHKHPAPAAAAAAAHDQPPLQCPRCNSTNTKFCYYNNYNLSQPRHFCKTCRRYWTKGGALRNIPVGGATRNKTKRRTRTPNKTTTAHASPLHQISVPSVEAEVVDDEQPLMLLDYCGIGSTSTFSSLLASNSNSNGQFGSYPDGDGDGDGGFLILGDSKGSEALWPDNWADLSIYTPGPSFQ